MPKKHALFIANTEYRDGKLAPMAHPGLAYAELAEALRDPARGAFAQVETLVNANLSHVLNTLDRFFSRKPADDVLLVYVGAHGFVDSQGELFLALKESDRFRLKSTALMAAVLGMNMDQCPSPHKLLILDCRFHSPYQDARGNQAAVRFEPAKVFAGRGLPKHILSAAWPQGPAAAPAPTSSTQKLQVVAPKDFTRALAEAFRTPAAGAQGARAPFTVEDWWNAAAADLKASKAEPPQLHAVGEPPVTILRGTSLPRPEMAFSPASQGRVAAAAPTLPPEPESEWSRLSGVFPLEMFAPELAASGDGSASETLERAPDAAGGAAVGEGADADGEEAGDEDADGGNPASLDTEAAATQASPADRTLQMPTDPPRGDQTIVADLARFVEGADLVLRARQGIESPRPLDLSDPDSGTLESPLAASPTLEVPLPETPTTAIQAAMPAEPRPGPRDTFTDLRARLRTQEELEQQARLEAEREEAAQREKLNQWKARWETRSRDKEAQAAKPETAPPAEAKPAAPAPAGESPSARKYRSKIAALQKTLYVPPPDAGPEADTRLEARPPAAPPPDFPDGTATVMVSKDQFLNTGVHKVPTLLTPGATIQVSREEFLGPGAATEAPSAETPSPAAAAAREAVAGAAIGTPAKPPAKKPGKPAAGGAREKSATPPPAGPGRGRRATLWFLAGLVPVGLSLLLYFGTKAGLFWSLGLGPDPAAKRAAAARLPRESNAPDTRPLPAPGIRTPEEEAVILPAESALASTPSAPPSAPAAAGPAVDDGAATPAATPATPSAVAASPAAPRTSAPAAAPAAPVPAPAPASTPAVRPKAALQPKPQAQPDVQAPAKIQARPAQAAQASQAAQAARAAREARDAERLARAQFRQDSLKAFRAYRDSLLTVRAQAKQDSIQQARLLREYERSQRAEAEAARLAEARVRQDSLRAHKDSVQSETLLRKSVGQALKSGTDEMRSLYNRFALGYPGLQGEVVLNLLVAPNGEIEKGAVYSSTTGLKMFDQLVLGNAMEWRIRPFKAREAKAILVAVKFPVASP